MADYTSIKLQNILLPDGEPYTSIYKLYDRESVKKVVDGAMIFDRGDVFDASTYFNSCSAGKWFEYGQLKNISLNLEIQGEFTIVLKSHKVKDVTPIEENARFSLEHSENILLKKSYNLDERKTITLEYTDISEGLVSFVIVAHAPCRLYGGCYMGTIDKDKVREVVLTISITPFKKEEFVLPNIELLRKEILDSEKEMADNFYVHVVDNGRTIVDKNTGHPHITIHGNNNVGGSGGYARGMIETIK